MVGGEFHVTTRSSDRTIYIGNNPTANGMYVRCATAAATRTTSGLDATELAEARRRS